MRRVAETVGVTHRAVAQAVGGRDALLRAVAVRGYEELGHWASGQPDRRAFAERYLRFALAEPRLYDVTMSRTDERWDDPALRAAALAVIDAARAAGCGTDDEIKRLWMILHGGVSLHRSGGLAPRRDEELIAFMLEMSDG